jgi:transposase-like protein
MSDQTRGKLEALAEALAKDIHMKTISNLSRQLVKLTVERALQAELDDHLGYSQSPKLR